MACSMDDHPYVVPISFGYDGSYLYFHSGLKGKKTSILKANPSVCLAFETGIELIKSPENPCSWDFHFSSVVAEGYAEEIIQLSDKIYALNKIMEHYSGQTWDFPENKLRQTRIWKIRLDSVSAKISPGVLDISNQD